MIVLSYNLKRHGTEQNLTALLFSAVFWQEQMGIEFVLLVTVIFGEGLVKKFRRE